MALQSYKLTKVILSLGTGQRLFTEYLFIFQKGVSFFGHQKCHFWCTQNWAVFASFKKYFETLEHNSDTND